LKFGVCCGLSDVEAVLAAGFDYVELPASGLLENLEAYRKAAPPVLNLFFPSSVRLFGPEATPWRPYALEVTRAAADIGVEVMVFGSGNARRDGQEGFGAFLIELGEIAAASGVSIAPESLNRKETNAGNDLAEVAAAAKAAGMGFTADSYHVITEWAFSSADPVSAAAWQAQIPWVPTHVHVGDRARLDPSAGDEDLAGFARRLRELRYDGRVSLECGRRGDLVEALASLRSLFETT
jgi:sugar phosphate isomerase/epimerase